MSFNPHLAGHLISRDQPLIRDTFGPTVEILTRPGQAASGRSGPAGTPAPDAPAPTGQEPDRMMKLSAERGYWKASPEENAAAGIELPPPPGA